MTNSRMSILCALLASGVACGMVFVTFVVAQEEYDNLDLGVRPVPGVPECYWFVYEGNLPSSKAEHTNRRKLLPFESISLERTESHSGPYTITFRRDGSASYVSNDATVGEFRDVAKDLRRPLWRGKFTGTIGLTDYGRLCFLLERLKFDQLSTDVRSEKIQVPHASVYVLRVTPLGAKEHIEVREFAASGTIELWAIQQVIDGLASSIEWEPQAKGVHP